MSTEPAADPLLTHTSGLDNLWPTPIHGHEPAHTKATHDLLRQGVRRVAPPGTRFAYSNHGFGLIGLVIGSLTDMTIEQALTRLVAEPVGASSVRFDEPAEAPSGTAIEGGAIVPAPRVFPLLVSAGGGWATATDVALFAENLLPEGPNRLPASAVKLLTTDQAPAGTGARSAGLALYRDLCDRQWAGHVGGWPGFSGAFLACPELNVACAVLTNQSTPHRFEIPDRVLGALKQ